MPGGRKVDRCQRIERRLDSSRRRPTIGPMPLRIHESIELARRSRGLAFLPFLAAGYPDREAFVETLRALPAAGADAVEIGFPFSDPIADGPTIQAAFAETLSRGFRIADVLAAVREARSSVNIPLIAMVSHSIVYRCGVDRFIENCREAGFNGVLIPDLPPPEAQAVCDRIRAGGLDTVLLVAPTTSPQRRREIARLCSGFVYYLSVSGITGERDQLPADLPANVSDLKSASDAPVVVGFGISKPEHLRQLVGVADGAVVGTAIVRKMKQATAQPAATVAAAVVGYCRELLSAVR